MVTVRLSAHERAVLNRQKPSTRANGGWQGLLVSLQEKVSPTDGLITLTLADLERIHRYAFSYRNGGWQGRLRAIFGRTLGPTLGRQYLPKPKAA